MSILSIASDDENDRVLTALIPHTTSTRGSRFEVVIDCPFLKTGAFDTQNIVTLPTVKLIRKLGTLTSTQLAEIEQSALVVSGCGHRVRPYGDDVWTESVARRQNLESTIRPRGRPKRVSKIKPNSKNET